jgi:hypothetical protein
VQEVGRIFSDVGMVSIGHWNEISGQMQEGGFYFVLDFIENKLQGILDGTWNLLSGIRAISDGIVSGKANRIMEENLPGNIKVAFATLYQEWSHFQQYFLASSMLSTELWYRHTKVGSLCESAHEMSLATV